MAITSENLLLVNKTITKLWLNILIASGRLRIIHILQKFEFKGDEYVSLLKKKTSFICMVLAVMLGFSITLSPTSKVVQAEEQADEELTKEDISDLNISEKEKGILNGVYYDTSIGELIFEEEEGKEFYDFNSNEISDIENKLAKIPKENIESVIKNSSDMDSEPGIQPQIAPLIWGGIAVVGILVGGGLIFSSMYFSHKEKTQLIDRCYDEGGTPDVESKDSAGVSGKTNSGAAKQNGGYKFECVK